MKKLFVIPLLFLSLILMAFTVDATLKNEDSTETLFLYENGDCVLKRATKSTKRGTYDLVSGKTSDRGKIYIKWDDRPKAQGTYTMVQNQVNSVSIEDKTYSCTVVARKVVPRDPKVR